MVGINMQKKPILMHYMSVMYIILKDTEQTLHHFNKIFPEIDKYN
jgi:hypothetical protein